MRNSGRNKMRSKRAWIALLLAYFIAVYGLLSSAALARVSALGMDGVDSAISRTLCLSQPGEQTDDRGKAGEACVHCILCTLSQASILPAPFDRAVYLTQIEPAIDDAWPELSRYQTGPPLAECLASTRFAQAPPFNG